MMMGSTPQCEIKEDGSFSLSNVGAEIYEPSVSGLPEGYYLKSVRIGDDELKAVGVDTTRGAVGPVLLLTISDKAAWLEGVVQNAKAQPVPGATVVLVPESKKREKSRGFQSVTTDQYGRYVMKTIEPGEYTLFAWEDIEPGEYMDPGGSETRGRTWPSGQPARGQPRECRAEADPREAAPQSERSCIAPRRRTTAGPPARTGVIGRTRHRAGRPLYLMLGAGVCACDRNNCSP